MQGTTTTATTKNLCRIKKYLIVSSLFEKVNAHSGHLTLRSSNLVGPQTSSHLHKDNNLSHTTKHKAPHKMLEVEVQVVLWLAEPSSTATAGHTAAPNKQKLQPDSLV